MKTKQVKLMNQDTERTLNSPSELNSLSPIISSYTTTKRRWFVLFAVTSYFTLNCIADSEACILKTMTDLLGLTVDKFIYISLAFSYVPLITATPTAWLIDKFGIRPVLQICVGASIIKTLFRCLLYSPSIPNWDQLKIMYWVLANLIGVQLQSVYYCTPLKVSEQWFKESERSSAWALMISSPLIGFSISAFIFPRLLQMYNSVTPLVYVNIICVSLCVIVIFSCINKSKPENPPNQRTMDSSSQKQQSYLETVRKIISHKDLLLNALHTAFFDGVLMAVTSVQQDILLSSGYTEIFIGDLMSINSFATIVMVLVLSSFVHRVNNVKLMCKLGSVVKTFLFISYLVCLVDYTGEWLVLLTSLSYNTWKSWMIGNFNNMTAILACKYIHESSASSVQTSLTVITYTINQVAFMILRRVNEDGSSNYTHSMLFSASAALLNTFVYIIFFKGKLKPEQIEESNFENNGQINANTSYYTEPTPQVYTNASQ